MKKWIILAVFILWAFPSQSITMKYCDNVKEGGDFGMYCHNFNLDCWDYCEDIKLEGWSFDKCKEGEVVYLHEKDHKCLKK